MMSVVGVIDRLEAVVEVEVLDLAAEDKP